MLSTLHKTVTIGNEPKKLPETVEYYNSTKYGVDVVDQIARLYSTKAGSRRWPAQVFYNVLDLAAINATVLYREVTGKTISRRKFLLQLAIELKQQYKPRSDNDNCSDDNDEDIVMDEAVSTKSKKRKQCQVRKCKGNKTSEECSKCKLAVCGKCTSKTYKKVVCSNCM